MTYRVLATYSAGFFQGLVAANGYFYAPSYDLVSGQFNDGVFVPDLLKLTAQGGIARHAAVLPKLPNTFQASLFVNNTLYGAAYCGVTNPPTNCVFAIGDGSFYPVVFFGNDSPGNTGDVPLSSLAYANGTFYGITTVLGAFGYGTIFSVSAAKGALVLHNFDQPYFPGAVCAGAPTYLTPTMVKVSGTLYGVTPVGGALSEGTFYAIDLADDSFRVLHDFGGRYDAAAPCGLVEDNGVLYGISDSGDHNYGTLFTISFGGFSSVLHAFSLADGNYPTGLLAADGKLFGVSSFENANAPAPDGTVWEYSSAGFRVLHTFPTTTPINLGAPLPQLVYVNGTLYGVTPTAFFAITGV